MDRLTRGIMAAVMAAGIVFAGGVEVKEAQAVASGEQWLALCDQAEYGESWEQAAAFFKNAVKKEQWEQMAAMLEQLAES